jgi:RNA polymerase sigma-32 factor
VSSRERVRQIEVRAFEKVQDAVRKAAVARERPRADLHA